VERGLIVDLRSKQQAILLTKISRRKEEIKKHMISNITPITDVVLRETGAFETYEEAIEAGGYRPVKIGDQWGGMRNGWFRIRFAIPAQWKGKEVAAYIYPGSEACAYIDGKPYQGVDFNHQGILLTKKAKGGGDYEIVLDAIGSHWMHWCGGTTSIFTRCELATRNPEVTDYWFDLEMLHQLAEALPEDSPRRARIIYLLNKSVDAFDYTHTDEASLKRSAKAASAILRPLLECKADASAGNVAVNGHSHIDVAWLWPYAETKRKCARTFSTVMRLMEQYPEYIFTQSQPQLYEFTKQNHPLLYEEIRKRVKEGRWDAQGAMWVEADCNVSSGESLVRQVMFGKRFFMDEFGIEPDVLWLPDVFGYSAALPQILKKARVDYFSTIKISWNQFNKFPYNTFHWKGIDGSSVLAHFPPTGDYNAWPAPGKLRSQLSDYAEADRCDWSLLSYGHGDGGGGPEERHLEMLRRARDLEGLPRCRQMKVSDFFHLIDGAPDLPEWIGELYLECHRGTYTTQSRNKRHNRRAELLYRDAELLSSIAAPMGVAYPWEELNAQWKRILCNQFHDVIPGSSIREVYEDTDRMYPEIMAAGEKAVDDALAGIVNRIDTTGEGDAIVVFNTLPWGRTDVVRAALPGKGDYAVLDVNGVETPSQIAGDEISFAAIVPSMGYSTYRLVKRKPAKRESIEATKNRLENGFYVISFDGKGQITSIIDKLTGREVVPEGARANILRLYEDKPNDFDAWDIDFFYDDKYEDITSLDSIEVTDGPVSASIEMTRSFGASKLRQKVIIYADNPRIDFETWVDWHEDYKCLKACFPVDVNASKARYEIQFGNVERPTHSNTSWDVARFEVCAHKWADLSEEGFGVSLMNDCKYGHHIAGNEMRLSLLRSPKEPDPMADMGEHVFIYSLMPHAGNYIDGDTVRQAYAVNVPMRAFVSKPSKGSRPAENSFISIDGDNVILETVKRAERSDATILRFYECHNKRGQVSVSVGLPFEKVYECDLMEDDITQVESGNGVFSFEIKPFEIRTFKLV